MDERLVRFDGFELDLDRLDLRHNNSPVEISPLPLQVLAHLAARPGQVISRDELRGELWGESVIGFDDRLNTCIAALRAALGDSAHSPRFVSTVRGRGYRFIGSARKPEPEMPRAARPAKLALITAFATAVVVLFGGIVTVRSAGGEALHSRRSSVSNDIQPEARELYLRAEHHLSRLLIKEDLAEAVGLLQSAVELEPEFALAHARLGFAASNLAWVHEDMAMRGLAESATRRARELAPDLPETLLAQGQVLYAARDYEGASRAYRRALKHRPADPELLGHMAFLQRRTGEWEQAADNFEKALERDPKSVTLATALAMTRGMLREWSSADRAYRLAIAIEPQLELNHVKRAELAVHESGEPSLALDRLMDGASSPGDSASRWGLVPRSGMLTRVLGRDYAHQIRAHLPAGWDDSMWILSNAAWIFVDEDLVRRAWSRVLLLAEAEERSAPVNGRSLPSIHLRRAVALAHLGRAEEAVHHLDVLLKQISPESDQFAWGSIAPDAARVLVLLGETERADALVGELLSSPSRLSEALLHADPALEPLAHRADETFTERLALRSTALGI